jgi:transposase-like protein
MKKTEKPTNLMDLMAEYDTDAECRAVLEALRWPDGVRCPRCEGEKVYRAEPRKQFDCASCGYQFSVTAGTIFHDSHLSLPKWFVVAYLLCESKKGMSANQIKRTIGVSYKTAWYLCHRIRAAMKDASEGMLRGIIEVDETLVGGKRTHVGKGYRANKSVVIGAVERGGNVRLKVIKRQNKRHMQGFVRSVVHDDAEAIYTDEANAYQGVGDGNTRHETVHHKSEEWVRADVHTNTVEGVWSLLKRSIIGSYHHLSAKHLPAYLDEISFRFNNRANDYLFRDTLTALLRAETMPYQELIREKVSESTRYRRAKASLTPKD